MCRFQDLRAKEVINIRDGCRYGYVCDVIVDICTGKIHYLVVPEGTKLFGFMGCDKEYIIAWKDVAQIGDDIILVDIDTKACLKDCK